MLLFLLGCGRPEERGRCFGVNFYRDPHLPFFELKLCSACDLSYKKHAHEEYSLGVVEHGESSFWHDGKLNRIYPQAVVLFPPALIHACNPDPRSRWQYKMLFVNADWVEGFLAAKGYPALDAPVVRYDGDSPAYPSLDGMLSALTGNADPLEKEAGIIAGFEQILRREGMPPDEGLRPEPDKLKTIREYLHSCFWEKITLEQLAQVSALNKFHIIRLFNEAFRIPPHAYQTLLRINYAKKELRKRRPLAEVALESGFYDQSHFIKAFKGQVGVTPQNYLANLH